MKLHPFHECVRDAVPLIRSGVSIYQEFVCSWCGVKQMMETPNIFYKSGRCEECGEVTDIEADGCNYMAVFGRVR